MRRPETVHGYDEHKMATAETGGKRVSTFFRLTGIYE